MIAVQNGASASVLLSGSDKAATATITIMVAVRGRLFREGLQLVLRSPERDVIGSSEPLDRIAQGLDPGSPPDLFVIGGYEPDQLAELFAGIRTLRSRIPKAKCIVLSPRTDPPLLRQALDAGADGLLLEDTPAEVLQLLTRLMLLGHPYVPTQVARAMYQGATQTNVERGPDRSASVCQGGEGAVSVEANDDSAPKPVSPPVMVSSIVITPQDLATSSGEPLSKIDLSGREKEILGCLVSGHSNKVIARQLDIAEATVKIHVKGLLRKMQVSNRTQAAVRALRYPVLPSVPSTF